MPSPIFIDHKEKRMENDKTTKVASVVKELYKGTMKLTTPIRSASKDITELHYDFTALTGWDYVNAMDSDMNAKNMFKVTSKQALCLFATAAAKITPDVDETDIKERIGASDAVKAVQLATVFLVTSTKEEKANT